MKVLIIGGTKFVGRHIAEALAAANHEVFLFHRGSTNPDILSDIPRIQGDREYELAKATGEWDAVVDTCAYVPRLAKSAAEAFRDRCKRYLFISTISVYEAANPTPIKENSRLRTLDGPPTEEVNPTTYGALKVLCEQAVTEAIPNAVHLRPGIVFGPHDPTDRFTYWVARCLSKAPFLAPLTNQPSQYIDARDLGLFAEKLLTSDFSGPVNAITASRPFTENLRETAAALGGVPEWRKNFEGLNLPIVIPEASWNMFNVCNSLASSLGLTTRPLLETAQATAQWYQNEGSPGLSTEIDRAIESKLLKA